jgi:hypothetical protein
MRLSAGKAGAFLNGRRPVSHIPGYPVQHVNALQRLPGTAVLLPGGVFQILSDIFSTATGR